MQKGFGKPGRLLLVVGLLLGSVFLFSILFSSPVAASTANNQTINFQGRLLNSAGATVPDGFYNLEFKIYKNGDGQSVGDTTGSPAGTLLWTEDWLNSGSHGVKVQNGYLSINLGSVNPFGSSIDWTQGNLWLSMQVGDTSSCTITTTFQSNCGGDGEMIPMQPLTASPYALNAGLLDGVSSAGFVQLAQGLQTDASNSTSIYINKTGTGNILDLQSGGADAFTVANSGDLTFGANTNHTLSVATAGSGNNGNSLTIASGGAGTGGSALTGGNLVLEGGTGGGTNGNGGNVSIDAGAKNGSGNDGNINIGTNHAAVTTVGNTGSTSQVELQAGGANETITNTNGVTIQGATPDNTTTALNVTNDNGLYLAQFIDDGTVNLGAGVPTTFGYTTVGGAQDTGDYNLLSGEQFVAGATGSISSLSAYIGSNVQSSPNNQYQMAVYADNGSNAPGSLIASTSVGTLSANNWNTLPISGVSVSSGQKYWLVEWNNGNGLANAHDNALDFNNGVSPSHYYAYKTGETFGTLPSSFPTPTSDTSSGYSQSFYATYANPGPALTLGSTGNLTAYGNATFADEASSTTALQVQNTTGYDVLTADTSSNSTQGQVILGQAAHNNGTLVFASSASSGGSVTLEAPSITSSNSYSLILPTAAPSGTGQCLQTSSTTQLSFGSCGATGSFINNSLTQQTGANFNIDGTGIAGTLEADTIDASTSGALNIGKTSGGIATQINLNQNTDLTGTLTLQGGHSQDITTTGSNNLSIDTAGSAALNIGTSNAASVTIGNTSATLTATLGQYDGSSTATVNVGNNAGLSTTQDVNIAASGSGINNVTIGSTSSTSTTSIQGGNGATAISAQAASGGTISIGTTNSNTVNLGYAPSTPFGNPIPGSSGGSDDGDLVAIGFTTGSGGAGAISSISAYVQGAVAGSPNNKGQVGIYSNVSGAPGSLLASSSQIALTASSWNSFAISYTLSASTTYWFVYWENSGAGENRIGLITPTTGTTLDIANISFSGSMPSSWPGTANSFGNYDMSIYANYANANEPAISLNPTTNTATYGYGTSVLLQGASAYFSNPQGNTDAESFGLNASAAASNATALGEDAFSNFDGTSVGQNSYSGQGAIAIGQMAGANALDSVSVGGAATANANYGVAVGAGSAANTNGVSIGTAAGNGADFNNSVAIGYEAKETTTNQLVIGGSSSNGSYVQNAYLGSGVTDTAPQTNVTLNATGGSGSNVGGENLTLAGGIGTGTGNGGSLFFQIAKPSGSSSSTANTLASVETLSGINGAATFENATNSTTAFQVQNSSGNDVMTVDTSTGTGQVVLGQAGQNNGTLEFVSSASSGGAVTLEAPSITSANSYSLILPTAAPSGSGQCLQTSSTTQLSFGTCGATGSFIFNQSTQQTSANFNIDGEGQLATLDATGSGSANTLTIGAGATYTGAINIDTNASVTSGTVTIGGTAQTGAITIGQATTATSQTVSIESGNGTASTQTVNIATGTSTTSGGNTVNIVTGTPGTSTSDAVNIGTGGTTTGTVAVTIGSNGNAAHTTAIQGGNGATAITLTPQTTGAIVIGAAAGTGAITVGSSSGSQTVQISNGAAGSTGTVNIANIQNGGSVSVGNGMTTGTVTIGGTAQTGAITVGQATSSTESVNISNANATAGTQTVNIDSGNGTASTQTVNIATGTSTTSGGKNVNIATGTPGTSTSDAVNIGTGGTTTGTVAVTIGSNGNAAHTTAIQGGNGATAITLTPQTTGAIVIGAAAGTGAITVGSSSGSQTVQISNGAAGSTGTVNIANIQNGGSVSVGNGMTTGTVTIGGTAQTGAITIGQATTATSQTVSIESGNGTASTQTVNIATGTSTTSGGNTVNIVTGTPGTSTSDAVNIGTGGTTTGTVAVTIGSNGNAAHTTAIQGGNGATAITLTPQTTGAIVIGAAAGTGAITVGSSSGSQTVQISNGAAGSTGTVNIANIQNGGSVSVGNGMTTGTVTIGGTAQTGAITIGQATTATSQTVSIESGNGTASTQTVNIATGTSTTSGGNTVNIVTGTPGTSTSDAVNIGTGGTTTGTVAVTIGSNGNAAHTTAIQGGNGATAITLTPQTTGAIVIGAAAGTGAITVGSSSGSQTVQISNGAAGSTGTVNIANIQNGGSVSVGNGMTTGTVTIGGTAQTGAITVGQATSSTESVNISNANATAGTQTVNIDSGNGTASTQTVNIATGTSTTSGGKNVNIATGTPGTSTSDAVNIGTGGTTTGTVAVTIGSNGNAAHTTAIQGGNGATAITLTPQTTGAIVIGAAAGTGAITVGSSSGSQTVQISNGAAGSTGTVNIANIQNGGSVSVGNGMTTGTVTIGGTAQTGAITIGQATTATSQTVSIESGNGTASTQTVNIATGTSTTSGGNTVNIVTGTPGTSTSDAVNIGTGGTTTGTVAVTIGSNGNAAHTTAIQGGNGATAITLTPQTTGAIVIGAAAGTGAITVGSSSGSQTVQISNGAAGSTGTVNIANIQNGGSVSVGNGMTTGTVTIGGTAQTGAITVGQATSSTESVNISNANATAGTQTVNIDSGNGTASTQTVNIATGTSTTSGGKNVNIATGTPGTSTSDAVNIGTGGTTTGTVAVTIGSNGNAAHTTAIQGGNGATAITLTPQTTGAIVIGAAAGTGAITVGSSSGSQTVQISNGAAGSTGTVNIANIQNGGSVSVGNGMTTGTVTIGGTAQTGAITIGQATTATSQTVSIESGNGTASTQTVNIATGTSTTSGGNTVNIVTGTPGTSTSDAVNIGTGGTTTGTVAVTIGSNGNAAHTTAIQGGNGATAITLTPQTTGAIVIGAAAGTGAITVGSSSGSQTVQISNGAAGSTGTVNIANIQNGGSVSVGNGMTTGFISLGGGSQTGAVSLGISTVNGTVNVGAGATATGDTETINIGNGADTGTGKAAVTVGNSANASSLLLQSGTGDVQVATGGVTRATFDTSNDLFYGNGITAASPNNFTLSGTESSTTAVTGGAITLQGGNATVGNANGGNLTLTGGTGFGSGVNGIVIINTPTLATTSNDPNCYTGGALVASSCTVAQATVNNTSAVIIGFSATGQTATLPGPSNTTAGKLMYVTAANGSSDFTLSVNGGGTGNTIAMRQNTTATMIWSGTEWTAAGASSSTTLQSAYNNTLQSAGGAELVVSDTSNTDGLNIRDSSTNPVNGDVLTVQNTSAALLFSVNDNVTQYASDGGAETFGGTTSTFPSSTWSSYVGGSGTSTVSRFTTVGNDIATGQGSVSDVTSANASTGVANELTTSLTANLDYNVSFAARLASGSGTFATMNVYYSVNSNTQSVACVTGQGVDTSVWTKVNCTFQAPASGITSTNSVLIYQTDGTVRTFYVDNLSVTINASQSYATDGGVDNAGSFTTNWPQDNGSGGTDTVTRSTSVGQTNSDSAQVTTDGTHTDQGVANLLSINPLANTLYQVTVYAASTSTFNTFNVSYSPNNGSHVIQCADYNTQSISTSVTNFTQVTCYIQTDSTAVTTPYLYFTQTDATARTFYVDTLSMTLASNTTQDVQIGGGVDGGAVTLLTLDSAAGPPIASNNATLLGSMYYNTTLGELQCYESTGWGPCGAAADTIVTLSPEYTNAVLHGPSGGTTGVGTMTSDFCSSTLHINDGTSSQPTICGSNETFNFYHWTSPQATAQTYAIYVTYQLPQTFSSFASGQTSLMGFTDSSNSSVAYKIYNDSSGGLTECGTSISVSSGIQTAWQTATATGAADPSTCSFVAGDSILFEIDMTASSSANAYVGNLNFTFANNN